MTVQEKQRRVAESQSIIQEAEEALADFRSIEQQHYPVNELRCITSSLEFNLAAVARHRIGGHVRRLSFYSVLLRNNLSAYWRYRERMA